MAMREGVTFRLLTVRRQRVRRSAPDDPAHAPAADDPAHATADFEPGIGFEMDDGDDDAGCYVSLLDPEDDVRPPGPRRRRRAAAGPAARRGAPCDRKGVRRTARRTLTAACMAQTGSVHDRGGERGDGAGATRAEAP
jgi:hypothetical protein